MIAGLVIVPLVSVFTPKPEKNLVDSAFASYKRKVMVEQSRALSDSEE